MQLKELKKGIARSLIIQNTGNFLFELDSSLIELKSCLIE